MSNAAILTDALRAFGSPKELARAANCHVVTAHRWRNGEALPDTLTLTRLMSKSRAVADAVLRMAGLDDLSLDLEQARLLRAVAELEEKRARRRRYVVEALGETEADAGACDRATAATPRRLQRAAVAAVAGAPRKTAEVAPPPWDGVERRQRQTDPVTAQEIASAAADKAMQDRSAAAAAAFEERHKETTE